MSAGIIAGTLHEHTAEGVGVREVPLCELVARLEQYETGFPAGLMVGDLLDAVETVVNAAPGA